MDSGGPERKPTAWPATIVRVTTGVTSVWPPTHRMSALRQASAMSAKMRSTSCSVVPGARRIVVVRYTGLPPMATMSFAFTATV